MYSEILLWNELKGKKLLGYDFHRQKPIDNYIVDFFCNDLMLAIEIDGDSHKDKVEYDARRQAKLEEIGITVIHFEHYYVIKHLSNVVNEIKN